jgi:hypothetical protein
LLTEAGRPADGRADDVVGRSADNADLPTDTRPLAGWF